MQRRHQKRRRPAKGKTATRWRSKEGMGLAFIVDVIRHHTKDCYDIRRRPLPWKYVVFHLEALLGYGVHAGDPDKLKADYWSAVNYFLDQHEARPPSLPDAYALVDLVEDHNKLGADGWEIDWLSALKSIHPDDHWITVTRLKARYDRALSAIRHATHGTHVTHAIYVIRDDHAHHAGHG